MQLFNTLTRKKEELIPSEGKKLNMYVCGITPYDTTHLGHAFVYVTFDALRRYLKFQGYEVIYTQNVTDVDDDTIKRAKKEGRDWKELGNFWTGKFLADLKELNVEMPDNYVRATEFIEGIIEMISKLVNENKAYEKNGNVYFDVGQFPEYGKLSGFNRDQMLLLAAERGADPNDTNKKDPLDFILWQRTKKDDLDPNFKSHPSWDSPWGKGRPGWHIECSAMAYGTLGDRIDIHGGGRDLVFPHHESEIAQSESFTGKSPYVKYWMHIAMLQYQGEKMSKSLGNLVLVSDLLKKYSPNTVRWLLLSRKYRNPWEFTDEMMDDVAEDVGFIEHLLKDTPSVKLGTDDYTLKELFGGLDDDFNTSFALTKILAYSFGGDPPLKTIKFALQTLGFNFK